MAPGDFKQARKGAYTLHATVLSCLHIRLSEHTESEVSIALLLSEFDLLGQGG